MVRFLLATLVGAIVYFAWGMAAWMVLPLHDGSMRTLPDEEQTSQFLTDQQLSPGYYVIPMMPTRTESMTDQQWTAAQEAHIERHRQGPIVSIIYADGSEPMPPSMMIGGLLINLVGAAVLGMVMSSASCCRQYWQRAGLGTALGVFVGVTGHGALCNWMLFPTDFVVPMAADVIIGWTLAGAAMAAIIRPQPNPTATAHVSS